MYTDAGGDEVSGISAADLAQRLVEHSSSRRKAAHRTVTQPTTPRAPLPARVEALVWSAASACGVVPRSSLLRGDIVQEAAGNTDGVLISLSLSPDVRFRFAQTRQRRLVCVLSARTSAASLDLRKVETAHFYWMDECVPWAGHDDRLRTAALQKKLISWALHTFAGNPHMKNISLQAIEAAFPALLAYAPHEREELAQQAAAMLGRGMVVWYGETLIKQYHDGPSSFLFPLLSRREERCATTLLFALANAQQLLAGRLSSASHAARYLLEAYGAANIALSPALTHALLIAASALADVYPCTPRAERTIHNMADGYLALLAAASVADVCSLVRSVESSPPPKMRSLLSQIHDVARRACCTVHHRLPPHRDGKAHARTAEEDDDVNAFFSVNDALHLSAATLESRLDAGATAQLPLSTSSPSDCEQRMLLLGWVPRWWEGSMQALHTGGATAETELKINAKTAAALLLEPMAGEQAMLAVIQKTRRRRRGDGVQFSSQAVRTALEEAGVRLKRRSFLQLVDTLALSDDVESRVHAATHFLQKQLVDDSHIRLFTHTLTAMQDS